MAKGTRRSTRRSTKSAPRNVVPSLSSDWYWEQDAELRFTRVQVRSGDPVEQALAEAIIGKRRWETGIEIEGAQRFSDGSAELSFARGAGLVGTVWQTGEPTWVGDLRADPRAMRTSLAESTGLVAAVVFPIWTAGEVTAVLDVTSRRMRAPHKRLHQALHVIAAMFGQYLERTAAEQAVRESEERFRSLTALSSDWYWEQDAEYRFTRLEGRQV